MAIIYSYPTVTPASGDLIVGTDITGKVTKNFTVGSIISSHITGTANTVPLFTGSNTIGDSLIKQVTFDASKTAVNVGTIPTKGGGTATDPYWIDNFQVEGTISSSGNITIGTPRELENQGFDLNILGEEGKIAFGDNNVFGDPAVGTPITWNVVVGEYGTGDTDVLQLHGKTGVVFTRGALGSTVSMSIDSSGKVGIGTGTPTRTLDVNGEIGVKGEVVISSSSGFLDIGQYLATSESKGLKFYADETLAMTIDTSANVGIGTSTPSSKLDVSGTVSISNTGTSGTLNLKSSSTASGGNYIHAKKSDNSNQWVLGSNLGSNDQVVLKQYNDDNIIFQNNSGDAVTIKSSGSVGIGTTNPQGTLDVNGAIAMKGAEQLIWDNGSGTLDIAPNVGQVKIFSGAITIDYSSNVGINTTSPVSRLHVDGGDVEVDDSTSGLILKSPNGTRYRIKVDNSGNLTTTAV